MGLIGPVLVLVGAALVLFGLWVAWPPLAFIAGGGLLVAAGFEIDFDGGDRQ